MTDTTSTRALIDIAQRAGLVVPADPDAFTGASHPDFMSFFLIVFGYDLDDERLEAIARAPTVADALAERDR